MDEHTLYAARDRARRPPARARPARARLGRRQRDRRARHRRRLVGPRGRARRAGRRRRARAALAAVRRAEPEGLPVRVRLPGPARHHHRRPLRARDPGRGRPRDWPARRRSRPTWSSRCRSRARRPRSATPRSGIPYGIGLVKNAYVGRTFIQPSQTIRQLGIRLKLNPLREVIARQAAGRGRRLDRARQHPAGARADAARGGGRRGARAHLVAAGEVAVLLRHRLRHPGRADRQRARGRRDLRLDRRRLARLRLARRAGRGDRRSRPRRLCRACFDGSYPIALPEPELLGKHVLEGLERSDASTGAGDGVAAAERADVAAVGTARSTRARTSSTACCRPAAGDALSRPEHATGRRDVRRRRRRHRGRRPRRRADEGQGARATRPEVVGGLGGFAGLFAPRRRTYRRPLLASSTDGVGTKLAIAQAMDLHDTIGIDLVAMVVDDLVVCGAEPLFMPDYIACGKVVPERIAAIVAGIAEGCRLAGCAARRRRDRRAPRPACGPTSTTSRAPASASSRRTTVLGPERVRAGDVVLAMASSGLHSNGYSLVRHVLLATARLRARRRARRARRPAQLGEELLTPTRIYALDCLALVAETEVHAFAHITGGGLAANLARVLPDGVDAVLDRSTWAPPAGLRPGRRARPGRAGGDGAHVQHGRRHGRRGGAGRRRRGAGPAAPRGTCPPGSPARWSPRPARPGRSGSPASTRHADARRTHRRAARRRRPVARSAGAGAGGVVLVVLVVTVGVGVRVVVVVVLVLVGVVARRRRPTGSSWSDDPASSRCRRSRSVPPLVYFSWRATFVCLALARPRPMARPPRSRWARRPSVDCASDRSGAGGCRRSACTYSRYPPAAAGSGRRSGDGSAESARQVAGRAAGRPRSSGARRGGRRPPPAARPPPRRGAKIAAVVSKIPARLGPGPGSNTKPSISSATWIRPPALTT